MVRFIIVIFLLASAAAGGLVAFLDFAPAVACDVAFVAVKAAFAGFAVARARLADEGVYGRVHAVLRAGNVAVVAVFVPVLAAVGARAGFVFAQLVLAVCGAVVASIVFQEKSRIAF